MNAEPRREREAESSGGRTPLVARRFLSMVGQHEATRTIGTDDLIFLADVKVDRRVAHCATAPVALNDAAFDKNGRLQMHNGC